MEPELKEPLSSAAAKALIRTILEGGGVGYRKHALDEMATDKLGPISKMDVTNVLKGGVVEPAEYESGSYRYRVRTTKVTVVVAFQSSSVAVVVTAWRNAK